MGKLGLMVDIFNVFNDTVEEGYFTENFFSDSLERAEFFVDPRRAMIGVRSLFEADPFHPPPLVPQAL